ncbi:MAG: NTP transferase domain-containing protein [Bacteriovoracaceae bacterium]|nr:NTP transferase domain-containing protein [Bacteriovoracaceae bacterium]
MKPLHIVMPMAGAGSRFLDKGFKLPKPLIDVAGTPMYLKALSSFDPLDITKKVTCVIRREHEESLKLGTLLKEKMEDVNIVMLDELTKGAAETCYQAKDFISSRESIVVLDCDLWFYSPSYFAKILEVLDGSDNKTQGILTYFKASLPIYSFLQIKNGRVNNIAEKKAISDKAIIGAYFFSNGYLFLRTCEKLLKSNVLKKQKEYYISCLYNLLLEENNKIMAFPSIGYNSFGTPAELEKYINLT